MMLNKNEIITLTVTDINSEGCGVSRVNGMVVFVAFAAVGDTLRCRVEKVLKTTAFAKILDILTPGPGRIQPDCAHFQRCGGCAFRHIDYTAELTAKKNIVEAAFNKIGGFNIDNTEIIPAPQTVRYRNKSQLVFGGKDDIKTGFYSLHSHRFIPIDDCLLQPKIFSKIAFFVAEYAKNNSISIYSEDIHSGTLRHLLIRQSVLNDECLLCFIVNDNGIKLHSLAKAVVAQFPEIKTVVQNTNTKKGNVVLGDVYKNLIGCANITESLYGNLYDITADTFFQVNTQAAQSLYSVTEQLAAPQKNDVIVDLFCGVGSIGLSFAQKVSRVIGVEVNLSSVKSARKNALRAGIHNADFIHGDVLTAFCKIDCTGAVVIIDPPRKGVDKAVLKQIITAEPNRIVMVSCNPSTAARDAAILKERYTLTKLICVDMFPRTKHIECVSLYRKQDKTRHKKQDKNCYYT